MTSVVVTAAVIRRGDRYLVTRRQDGVHLAGFWEFPGGKVRASESLEDAVARELGEELDVRPRVGQEILSTSHAYDDRTVELHFFECDLTDEPRPQQGQEMRWASIEDLKRLEFPPADADLIRLLAGPSAALPE
jgi:mutator protein MutT